MQIAEVDQGVGNRREVTLGPLDLKDLAIALLSMKQVVHERTRIAKVTQRIRQSLLMACSSVISDCCFPGGASLNQIATMKKDSGAMFMVFAHRCSVISTQFLEFRVFEMSTRNSIRSTICCQSPPFGVSRLYSTCSSSCSSNPSPARNEL